MQSDLDRWLSAIRANPAVDAVRLEFADWLEEKSATADGWRECGACKGKGRNPPYRLHGPVQCQPCSGTGSVSNRYAEWAEFVRVQIELATGEPCDAEMSPGVHYLNPGACDRCLLRSRERELWPLVRERFAGDGWHPVIDGSAFTLGQATTGLPLVIVRRGMPHTVRGRLEALTGGECGGCGGNGRVTFPEEAIYTGGNPFVVPCSACHGTGRTPGVLAKLAAWPIEKVEVSDMPIHKSGGNDTYYLGGLGRLPQAYWSKMEGFRSPHEAKAALSDALLELYHREPQARRVERA